MSARVSRESSVQPMVSQMPPEKEVAKPATPQVCKATADDVERFRAQENDGRAGKLGTALEQHLRSALGRIPDGGEVELEVKGAVTAEGVTGQAGGRVSVERRGDEHRVTVDASIGAGIGKKGAHDSASVTGNVEGKVTLRYGSGEEAADSIAALMQVGAGVAGGAVGAVAISAFGDDDARARALHALDKVQTVELSAGVTAELRLEKHTPIEGMKAAFGAGVTATPLAVKLDFEKGEVVVSSSVSADARAMLQKELGESGVDGVTRGVDGTAKLAVEGHYPMSREDLGRIRKDPRELPRILSDPSRQVRWEAEATLTGHAPGVEVTAHKRGPPVELMAQFGHLDFTSGEDWHIESSRVLPGPAFAADGGIAELEVGSTVRFPVEARNGSLTGFAAALKEGQQHQAQESHLPAYRVIYLR